MWLVLVLVLVLFLLVLVWLVLVQPPRQQMRLPVLRDVPPCRSSKTWVRGKQPIAWPSCRERGP